MNLLFLRSLLVGSLLVLASLAPASAAESPRDQLLRLVPDDVGFVVVVQDLRGHSENIVASPFYDFIMKAPQGMLRSIPELQQLLDLKTKLEKSLKVDFAKVRDDILGDAVVFSFRPGPAEKPDEDQDLLLIHARNPMFLGDLIEKLNKAQIESKDLKKLETLQYRGQDYIHRIEEQDENYMFHRGPLLILSTQEAAIKQAIDRLVDPGDKEPALTKRIAALGTDKALVVGWANPRAFDGLVAARFAEGQRPVTVAQKTFLQTWKALDEIAVTVSLDDDVQVALSLRARVNQLPPGVRRTLAETAKPSDLWDRVPEDAMIAFTARTDPVALLDAVCEFLPPEERKNLIDELERSFGAALGQSVVKDLLPFVGPDWGVIVMAPPKDDQQRWFPHVMAAVRVTPGNKVPPVDKALWTTVDSFALLTVLDYNRQHKDKKDQLILKTTQDKGEIKYFVNDKLFPPGLQPAYALHDGHFVVGSSPEAVRRFKTLIPTKGPKNAEEFPMLRVSFNRLREYLKDRREPLARAISENNKMPREEVVNRLEALQVTTQLLERLELVQRPGKDQTHLLLRLQLVRPLRKP